MDRITMQTTTQERCTFACLNSINSLEKGYEHFNNIRIDSKEITIGRALDNTVVIPNIFLSRNHCKIKKNKEDKWVIEDFSTYGLKVNSEKLSKGLEHILKDGDIIQLDGMENFIYKFVVPNEEYETPRKRMKLKCEPDSPICVDITNDVRLKFEESQSFEIEHLEKKIQNAKQLQSNSIVLKQQLELKMTEKIQQLKDDFLLQIKGLNGEKTEVERQKALLEVERDNQLVQIKQEMEDKITDLMSQIQKHNDTETELLKENNTLKDKLTKERELFLEELNRESTSKQDLMEQLKAKILEQEEARLKEKQELEDCLKRETELLRASKEKELKELEDLKILREKELEQELSDMKNNLQEQVQKIEENKAKAEQELQEKMEQMKKVSEEDKIKMEELSKAAEKAEKKMLEAQEHADKNIEELKERVTNRETELAALAAERIQLQADQSAKIISNLQEQLEKVQSQLKSVECEKNTKAESEKNDSTATAGPSKEDTFGEIMENELQCSICAGLLVMATTLNCSHTYCKYCITKWKNKKKECPICRTPITSECRSLVLDSFIDKMVQNLTDEMKTKRQEMLKEREELEAKLAHQTSNTAQTRRREPMSTTDSEADLDSSLEEEEEEEDLNYENYFEIDDLDLEDSEDEDEAEYVEGLPDAYYGGYGRCYTCHARGHWAPGCPFS